LISQGTCSKAYAGDLLEDLFGYSDSESAELIAKVPAEVAQSLNYDQAQALAQVLTEYGLEVAVCDDADSYITTSDSGTAAIQEDGSLTSKILEIIGTLSIANKVRKIIGWTRPSPREYIFKPNYRWYYPPVHSRRTIVHNPQPRREVRNTRPKQTRHTSSKPHTEKRVHAKESVVRNNKPSMGSHHGGQAHGKGKR